MGSDKLKEIGSRIYNQNGSQIYKKINFIEYQNVQIIENCYIVVSTIFGPSGPPPGRAKMTKKVTFRLPCKRRKSLLPENHQKTTFLDKIWGELL
jgi:hypothetical protein